MDHKLMHLLRAGGGAVRAAMRDALVELDLTPAQNTALRFVANQPGSSPAELSRHMRVTPQTMHKLVTDLEHRGLLSLTPREGHRKILDTNLTEEGRELLAEADERIHAIEQRLTGVLSARQRQQLVTLLQLCVDTLTPPEDDDQPVGHRPRTPSGRSGG